MCIGVFKCHSPNAANIRSHPAQPTFLIRQFDEVSPGVCCWVGVVNGDTLPLLERRLRRLHTFGRGAQCVPVHVHVPMGDQVTLGKRALAGSRRANQHHKFLTLERRKEMIRICKMNRLYFSSTGVTTDKLIHSLKTESCHDDKLFCLY